MIDSAQPERGTVLLSFDDIDTPITDVTRSIARLVEVEVHGTFLCSINQVLRRNAEGGIADCPPVVGVVTVFFHRAITDEFGIDTAIACMVNLLIEDAVVQRTNNRTTLGSREVERYLRRDKYHAEK